MGSASPIGWAYRPRAVRLHQELVARGYKGSYASVRDHLIRRLPGGKKDTCKGAQLSPVPLPVRHVMFLFLRRPEDLDKEERGTLLQLRQSHLELDLAYTLVQEFTRDAAHAHWGEP